MMLLRKIMNIKIFNHNAYMYDINSKFLTYFEYFYTFDGKC